MSGRTPSASSANANPISPPRKPSPPVSEQVFVGVGIGAVLCAGVAGAVHFVGSAWPLWGGVFVVLWGMVFMLLRLRWTATLVTCLIVLAIGSVVFSCAGFGGQVRHVE